MPTYEYACTACGYRFEAVQAFSDPALTICPTCQGRLRKVFGNVGIVLKGSGFYRTDSRPAGSNGSKAKTESAGATSESTHPSSNGSSQPAAASTSTSAGSDAAAD
jgi:putative FmdB family regulatory protein